MSPKDTLFNSRPCEIFFATVDSPTEFSPLGEVVADSLSLLDDNEPTDSISAPQADKFEFTIGGAPIDHDVMAGLLGIGDVRKKDAISVIIQMGKEYIYRPKNLKYPNKKRAKRIWKKWRRRYGAYYPKQVVMPKCTMTTEMQGNDLYTKITAQP